MVKNDFIATCKREFSFLIDQYHYKMLEPKRDPQGIEINYKSKLAGITIRFEPRENHILVKLHRLSGNKIPPPPIFIEPDTTLNSYYIDELFAIRQADPGDVSIVTKRKMPYEPIQIPKTLEAYSRLLKQCASDILNGDFKIFSELERIVKENVKKRQKETQ